MESDNEARPTDSVAPIDRRVDIGHVHLKVADIEHALAFYCGVLGFELQQRLGDQAAFISAGGYHHHIGLNTWESKGGSPPPPGRTGLYHVAIRYPDRHTLADALQRLIRAGIPLDGASDHGVSEALYLSDPDGNGLELYRDRPEEEWPRPSDGRGVAMVTSPLDLQDLLSELDSSSQVDPAAWGTLVKHRSRSYNCRVQGFRLELDACDRDGIGVELYRDRPRDQWPEQMTALPLDVRALLAEASA